jgi:hypothetical protein
MKTSDPNSKPALGFLTVIEDPQQGLFGGYLILNMAGRPLEFHCTAPIQPNRAQQILYGPTLQPYLFGEQIGQTLFTKAKTQPLVLLADREPVLVVRDHIDVPVALVLPSEEASVASVDSNPPDKLWRVDSAHAGGLPLTAFRLGRNRLAVPDRLPADRQLVAERLGELAESFDLAEPFARIREAIEEARRGG